MKILLSNKFYYPKGGDCVYSMGLEKLLKKKGHDVAFFAMKHAFNEPSAYSDFFPSAVDYTNKNFTNLFGQIGRPIYSIEVKKKFTALLEYFKPDIVHVNNIHSQLSPLIVQEAYKKGIPVVWTLHDYKLICSRYDSLRNEKPCELCYKNKINVVRHKCMKNSKAASLLAYAEAKVWNQVTLQKYTSKFICPSNFLKEKMVEGGFDPSKLLVLPNFINDNKIAELPQVKEDYLCFIGRLSIEKGINVLCEAASQMPNRKLFVIGTGPEEVNLKSKYSFPNIYFLGHKNWNDIQSIISKAKCLVLPSKWYENNPLSIIEAFANGTPVIGAKIGGIPEMIDDGINGLLFTVGDINELKEKINFVFDVGVKWDSLSLIENAKKKFSADIYYDKLMHIYENLIDSKL